MFEATPYFHPDGQKERQLNLILIRDRLYCRIFHGFPRFFQADVGALL